MKSKLRWLIALIPLFAGAIVLYMIQPENTWWMPPCVFYEMTGLYCPGCGTARGFHKLLHGDLLGAWRMNPLTVLMIPLTIYLIALCYRKRPDGQVSSPPNWLGYAAIVAIIAFWILRNIPAYPFTLLAPH